MVQNRSPEHPELADDFIYWAQDGIRINLCSLNQIDKIGKWARSGGWACVSTLAKDRAETTERMWVDRRRLGSGKMI